MVADAMPPEAWEGMGDGIVMGGEFIGEGAVAGAGLIGDGAEVVGEGIVDGAGFAADGKLAIDRRDSNLSEQRETSERRERSADGMQVIVRPNDNDSRCACRAGGHLGVRRGRRYGRWW